MTQRRILEQISLACRDRDDWADLLLFDQGHDSAGIHIACMVEPFLTYILEGRKTIESRFSKPLISPFRQVAIGDTVLLKAGPIVASFCVASAEFVELDPPTMRRLMDDYSEAICADDDFWAARIDKRYATLLGIADVRELSPLRVAKQDRRGWLVLRDSYQRQLPTEQLSLAWT